MTRPPTEAAYPIFATTLSECSHIGHSKVRNSCPGLSGTMRASSICVPHFEHSGRIASGCKRVMAHAPISGGSTTELSATDAWGRAAAGDAPKCALIEQIANYLIGHRGFQIQPLRLNPASTTGPKRTYCEPRTKRVHCPLNSGIAHVAANTLANPDPIGATDGPGRVTSR
jgi:hypothetical protein